MKVVLKSRADGAGVAIFAIEIIVERLLPLYPWLEYVGYAIAAAVAIPVVYRFKDREIEGLLRNHWASRNGSQRKE